MKTIIEIIYLILYILVKPTLPDNYQEKTWEKLQKAVVAIQTSKSIEYSLEELYQAVENMCSHKMDSQLYTKLTALTESHVKLNIRAFFSDTNDKLVSRNDIMLAIEWLRITVYVVKDLQSIFFDSLSF